MPLVSSSGKLIGMISIYFETRIKLGAREEGLLDLLARQSADYLERKDAEIAHEQQQERLRLLLSEVNHGSRNILSLVQAIAWQTAAGEPKDFVHRFEQRLKALAAGQDLVVSAEWKAISLSELVRTQLGHFQSALGTRIVPEGPDIPIEPSAAQTLGMGLHELATNASKYGALSNDTGQVAIAWNCRSRPAGQRFEMLWSESNGPKVHEPGRRGFGSTVLEDVIKGQFRATVALGYPTTGVVWRMECPADAVLAASDKILSKSA